MPDDKMDDLFSRLRPSRSGEKSTHQTPPSDDKSTDYSEWAKIWSFLSCDVDKWIASKLPSTFKVPTSRGNMYLTKDKKTYTNLVNDGHVVFSPLEIERFLKFMNADKLERAARLDAGKEEGDPAVSESLVSRIYELKKYCPGAKLYEMKLENDGWEEEELEELDE